jgi:hypothetical protein
MLVLFLQPGEPTSERRVNQLSPCFLLYSLARRRYHLQFTRSGSLASSSEPPTACFFLGGLVKLHYFTPVELKSSDIFGRLRPHATKIQLMLLSFLHQSRLCSQYNIIELRQE